MPEALEQLDELLVSPGSSFERSRIELESQQDPEIRQPDLQQSTDDSATALNLNLVAHCTACEPSLR
jgi:hypothetical protein